MHLPAKQRSETTMTGKDMDHPHLHPLSYLYVAITLKKAPWHEQNLPKICQMLRRGPRTNEKMGSRGAEGSGCKSEKACEKTKGIVW